MSAGRPKVEIDMVELEKLASVGLNEQQIADYMGVSTDTFGRRKKDDPDFAECIKRGKSKGIAKIANNLYAQSCEGNVSAGIFFMKNRAGWSDKQDLNANVKTEVSGTVKISPI